MTKQEYMTFHLGYCGRMMEVTKKKNADYTGGGDDPFANFRKIGDLVQLKEVDIVEVGLLTRISDKLSRIGSFIEKGHFQVADESFLDTCLDASNYFALLAGYHVSKKLADSTKVLDEGSEIQPK